MRPAPAALFACLTASLALAGPACAATVRVLRSGLGSGTVTSNPAGIACGTDCDEVFGAVAVTLTATAAPGSTFVGWDQDPDADPATAADCTGTGPTCVVSAAAERSVRPVFDLSPAIPTLASFTPAGIAAYLAANPSVASPARFVRALPAEFKQNWILMTRSESLQTGTAALPRILLPSADARFVFTIGVAPHSSYPGSHPNAIEYMQWDAAEKNFRFHEVVLAAIPAMGSLPARTRGVSIDDEKCSKCHSTRNVLNRSSSPGTTGIPPGAIKAKNKPNWDSYDSWGGMTPFNRDRIYQGSVEAAAFRRLFNPWTWRTNDGVRSILEQLRLQPPGVVAVDRITRRRGGANDGHVDFAFDASPPVLTEPPPAGSVAPITTGYSFDGLAGTPPGTSVVRGGSFVHLRHSGDVASTGINVEGRGVQLFDLLGGLDGNLNPQRIADELAGHRTATGNVPIDARPIALAIVKRCLAVDSESNTVVSAFSPPALAVDLGFFDARNGMGVNEVLADTRARAQSLPRRKADIQKLDLHRAGDVYLIDGAGSDPADGLVLQYGAATSAGTGTSLDRLRQEVFRRPVDLGAPDATVMSGIYVDRELHAINVPKVGLFRYFLEPLGVSVDKWSMGVRGRSRTYTFADVFGAYENTLQPALEASLAAEPVAGLTPPLAPPFTCPEVVRAVNHTLSALPAREAVPTYTDVQRIFNKSCIECHGGLRYPPYEKYGSFLDLSEDEDPPSGDDRLERSHRRALAYTTTNPGTSLLYQRIVDASEACPNGMMPCGGPPLSRTDVETIRRWIVGGRPKTVGDPHLRTVDGVDYDFQAAGEFVLLRGQGLEIQARHTAVETEGALGPNPHTGLTSCVSVNGAVAVRVGPHRVTYQPRLAARDPGLGGGGPEPPALELRVDGKVRELAGREFALPSGGRILLTSAPGGVRIEAPGGTSVVVTPGFWDHYQIWYLNVDVDHARATEGLMGAIAPGNWLPALPDGRLLGPRPADPRKRYEDLYSRFGDAWRVSDRNSLFDYAPGTSTSTFTVKSWPLGESPGACLLPRMPGDPPGIPPPKGLPPEVAQQHCREVADPGARAHCVADVRVTGEIGFARTYLAAEAIARNGAPTPPVLVTPEAFATGLAARVAFTWRKSTDPEGAVLTYRHCVWGADELYDLNRCAVLPREASTAARTVVTLSPGKAYFWKLIAEDGQGGVGESETRRFEIALRRAG